MSLNSQNSTETENQKNANVQWGGRFAGGPSEIMQAINASIGFDKVMWKQDIAGSLAHAAMLAHVGIISKDDEATIRKGLTEIGQEIAAGNFPFPKRWKIFT